MYFDLACVYYQTQIQHHQQVETKTNYNSIHDSKYSYNSYKKIVSANSRNSGVEIVEGQPKKSNKCDLCYRISSFLKAAMGKEKSVDTSGSSESDLTSTTDDSEKGLFKLRREIGLVEGAAITVGSIIGSGIFISPKGVVESVGSVGLSLVVWVASGILSVIGAICYAELGTSFPDSGGEYHYLRLAFGDIPAFLFMWSSNVIFV